MVNISIEYTSKPISPWGGMRLMKELLDKTKILEYLEQLNLPYPGSNRGYNPCKIIEAFWVSIWIGASRFIHSDWLRYDKVLKEIFHWKRVPSQSTYSRFFHKFTWQRNNSIFPDIQCWFLKQLKIDHLTLDLDSSVITRYGNQEGSKRGYNPSKPGRPSHHPLMAFMSQTRMVVNAWLRPGNTAASSNCVPFLEETFDILKEKKVGLVRADSGFYSNGILNWFENRNLNYIIAAKIFKPLQWEIRSISNWIELSDGIQVNEINYQPFNWSNPRRFIVVRKHIEKRPKSTGKLLLFDDYEPLWRYSVFVTNMDLPADEIWQLYRNRADAENRIKELKYDFGIENFCLKEFWATESAFRFIMVAYNLMSLFRHIVLQTKTQNTLSTLRFKCFAIGSWISKHSNKKVLKLSVSGQRRVWLDGLFSKVGGIGPPFEISNA